MKGILAHSSYEEYLDIILDEGKLKPISSTNVKSFNEYHGSNIFFTLIPEDINVKSKNFFANHSIVFYFKSDILETYGKKKFKPTKYDKEVEEYNNKNKYTYPKQKVWFNTGWNFGLFKKKNSDDLKSINYEPDLSLQDNIKLFSDILHEVKPKNIFKDLSSFNFHNELVIQSNSIPFKKNLLTIYLDEGYVHTLKFYRERYPEYTFVGNNKELAKIVKEYYETI
jgi:hypothetical protein